MELILLRDYWRALVHAALNLGFPRAIEISKYVNTTLRAPLYKLAYR